MPKIAQLFIYPVKAFRGISSATAKLTVRGLEYDRNWMLVDKNGRFISQRSLPKLAAFQVGFSDECLTIQPPAGTSLAIPLRNNSKTERLVDIWGDRCQAFDEGNEAAAWIEKYIGTHKGSKIRLVRFKDQFKRSVDSAYLNEEDAHTAFADGFPFLVTSESSLNRLNERLTETGTGPIPMNRFRPNIVIKGTDPFLENEIDELSAVNGSYRLGLRKPCKRCKVTTVDQNSGTIAEPKEPLRTLTLMNTVPGLHGAYFGQNAILLSGEDMPIRIGDHLEIKP